MVVFGLVGGEGLVAAFVAAGVGPVAGVAEEVPREFGALLEVFGGGFAAFPLAEAVCAVVHMGSFDVLVQCFGGFEEGEAEEAWPVLPGLLLVWMLFCGGTEGRWVQATKQRS